MIGIVVISYKNFQGTVDFINNQLPKLKMSWKAVVIDNASDIKSSQQMAQVCEGVCTSALSTVTDEKNNVFIIVQPKIWGLRKVTIWEWSFYSVISTVTICCSVMMTS